MSAGWKTITTYVGPAFPSLPLSLSLPLYPFAQGTCGKRLTPGPNSMGEHARYVDQDGVGVFSVHVDIADPQETADVENNLFSQLYVSSVPLLLLLIRCSLSPLTPIVVPPTMSSQRARLMEVVQSKDAAQKNQVRFYRTSQKLSDGGGGVMVYYNGKKIAHKKVLMGSLPALVEAVSAALEKYNSH
jgi:hypothetical protein